MVLTHRAECLLCSSSHVDPAVSAAETGLLLIVNEPNCEIAAIGISGYRVRHAEVPNHQMTHCVSLADVSAPPLCRS